MKIFYHFVSHSTNQDPVGNYTPLKLTDIPVHTNSSNASKKLTSKTESLGGGWSSSSDEEENVLEEFSQHVVSESLGQGDNVVNQWCSREDVNNLEILSTLQVGRISIFNANATYLELLIAIYTNICTVSV